MATHWLFDVSDGEHFRSSMKKGIWGTNASTNKCGISFLNNAKAGDILWFKKAKKSGGMLCWVATFVEIKERVLGPLIALTQTNEELGWVKQEGTWTIEVHYKDLYDIEALELDPKIDGQGYPRRFNDNCKVDLPAEYPLIVRYSKATKV